MINIIFQLTNYLSGKRIAQHHQNPNFFIIKSCFFKQTFKRSITLISMRNKPSFNSMSTIFIH